MARPTRNPPGPHMDNPLNQRMITAASAASLKAPELAKVCAVTHPTAWRWLRGQAIPMEGHVRLAEMQAKNSSG